MLEVTAAIPPARSPKALGEEVDAAALSTRSGHRQRGGAEKVEAATLEVEDEHRPASGTPCASKAGSRGRAAGKRGTRRPREEQREEKIGGASEERPQEKTGGRVVRSESREEMRMRHGHGIPVEC